MNIATYSNFRQNLKGHLDQVLADHTPLYIARAKGEDVVVISKEDYEGILETLYLLSSPANATRLRESLDQYKTGHFQERQLIEA